jgi:HSP20 family protein
MNPFTLMRRMSEELDRAFSESGGRDQGEMVWAPPIEVTQQDGNYVVRAEIPGINANDVKLEITDDAVVIQGERKSEHEEKKGGMHLTERRYGRFYRAIPLPEGAKVDQVRAKCEDGVLEVIVPTEEQRHKAREIPIQGGTSGSGEQSGAKSGSAGSSNKAA